MRFKNPCFWDLQDACFLGVDIDEAQLQKASENIAFAELENRINLLKASSLGRSAAHKKSSKVS